MLAQQHEQDSRWRAGSFARNFGHQTAVTAGLDFSRGDVIAVLDADLQDPPEELALFLNKWVEGFDVVYAIRRKRKENLLKRACYWFFYRLMSQMVSFDLPLDSGDFCMMDRRVVDVLKAMPERTRFVRGLRAWAGFKQTGVRRGAQVHHAQIVQAGVGWFVFLLHGAVEVHVLHRVLDFLSVPGRDAVHAVAADICESI